MPPKANPLRLNRLQLKTLTILQALAQSRDFSDEPDADGTVLIRSLPRAHGDHFHIGDAILQAKDATGLVNISVYNALARKGLLLGGPTGMPVLTPDGLAYDTGLAGSILHRAEH